MESIEQKPGLPAARRHLPDLRNLGVVLRMLLLVNGLAAVTALVIEPDPSRLAETFLVLVGRVELPLFLLVLVFFAAAPWLARLRWSVAAPVVLVVVLLVVAAVHPLLATPGDALWRWFAWAVWATALVLAYFEYRERRLTPALTEARLMALTARIRPHFLFNALNGVLGVIRSDPRRAERALEELAELFRVLMRDDRGLVALGDEIELCRRYLGIEELRLGDRLAVRWEVEAGVESVRVPPLTLQPLLENAIYHGIERLAGEGEIVVCIERRGGELRMSIDNPVPPDAPPHAGNRIALGNIRERLRLYFDLEASLESRASAGRHQVVLRLPTRKGGAGGEDSAAYSDRR